MSHVLEFPRESPAHQLQFQETQDAQMIADCLAFAAYRAVTIGDLDPSRAALCRLIAQHALRSFSQAWSDASAQHAMNECLFALNRVVPNVASVELARFLTASVLAAHHAILDGTICLTPDKYLEIAMGKK